MKYRSKQLQDENDYRALLACLQSNFNESGTAPYLSPGDLEFWRYTATETPDEIRTARLWFDETGGVAGFLWPCESTFDHLVHYRHRGLEREILELGEKHMVSGGQATVSCMESDSERHEFLKGRGYAKSDRFSSFLIRDLRERIPEPDPPEGYSVRNVTPKDVPEKVEILKRVQPHAYTTAHYTRMLQAPTYREELDLVAVTDRGEFVASLNVWLDSTGKKGVFEPFGCHPDHRRKGIARSLHLEGFGRLRAAGAESVIVQSGDANAPAVSLNRSVGFQEFDRMHQWWKSMVLGTPK